MPRIFDNIDQSLLPALRETINVADRADFCVALDNIDASGLSDAAAPHALIAGRNLALIR